MSNGGSVAARAVASAMATGDKGLSPLMAPDQPGASAAASPSAPLRRHRDPRIVDGGKVATNSLSVRSGCWQSTSAAVARLPLLAAPARISVAPGGILRVLAAAGVAADGARYTPVLSGDWTGTGTFQGVGGTLDKASRTFTPSPAVSGASGTAVPLELASVQRTLIDDGSTGWEVGASFPAASSTTNITFTATPLGSAVLASLQDQLPAGESLLSGWSFSTTNYSVNSANPVYLSFRVGAGHSSGDFDLWHCGGSAAGGGFPRTT